MRTVIILTVVVTVEVDHNHTCDDQKLVDMGSMELVVQWGWRMKNGGL